MSYGLYIHWPFCRRKCPYCSFTSVSDAECRIGNYAEALIKEYRAYRSGIFAGKPDTIYLGGGTPSLVSADILTEVLEGISPEPGIEITVEANPDSLSEAWLDSLRTAGVNRVSIGVQALDDRLLENLGRLHDSARAEWAVRTARRCGYGNVSIDLMFGIPGQTVRDWTLTLDRALALEPDHVSAYSLGLEEDTPFFKMSLGNGLEIPDSEETAEMYLLMVDTLWKNGLERYEISNFARPGRECRHNEGYWNLIPYLGIGASAHSFDGRCRWWNEYRIDTYLRKIQSVGKAPAGREKYERESRALEELMLSLRQKKGLNLSGFNHRYPGISARLADYVTMCIREGLLSEVPGGHLALTDRGALVADEILSDLALEFEDFILNTERNDTGNV